MSNLYCLRRPVHDILDEWLEKRDPVNPFKTRFDRQDYLFSTDNINFDRENARTVGSSVATFSTNANTIPALVFDPKKLTILHRLGNAGSTDNIVLQVEWDGAIFVLKVNQQSVDDLVDGSDRHLTELNAYNHLLQHGLCDEGSGVAPHPYGHLHIWGRQHPGWASHMDRWPYDSWLQQIDNPAEYPRAILMEYIPNVSRLPSKQFTTQNLRDLLDALATVHAAGVVHSDMGPQNVLWNGLRFVILDFEKATLSAGGTAIDWGWATRDLQDLWGTLMHRRW